MNAFKEAIKTEQKRIQRLIDLTSLSELEEPRGSMQLEQRGNATYCYVYRYQNGKRVGKRYLGKLESDAVREFVAESYRAERLQRLKTDQRLLTKLDAQYLDYGRSAVTAALPTACRKALNGSSFGKHIFDGSAFSKRYEELCLWAHADYERNSAPFYDSENYAVDGTRTRSKGETIFYNIFYEAGVLFRFDCLITYVDEKGVRHILAPDFLIQCFDGSFVAIEHLGWTTGLTYGINIGEKCYYYLQKGFILGKNLFLTSDDKHGGTDSKALRQVALHVQKMFFGF